MINQSTGATLRQAREQRNLTVLQVAEKTKIRSHYVQALENDDFAAMPSLAQARGFLRIYADFLGLDVSQLIAVGPAVEEGASSIPPSTMARPGSQDAATGHRARPSGLLSSLRHLWSPRGRGNVAEAHGPEADAGQGAGGPAAESPGGESSPEASADDLDPAKKKRAELGSLESAPAASVPWGSSAEGAEPAFPEQPLDQTTIPAPAEPTSAGAEDPNRTRANWRLWISALAEGLKRLKTQILTSPSGVDDVPNSAADGEMNAESGQLSNAGDFNPAPRESDDPDKSSDRTFLELGALLRERREMLSLTYDEVERHIRVRAAFLKSLEDGALDSLPSPVQTRGILANYAAFLDLEVDTILLRFAEGLQARLHEQKLQTPSRTRTPMTVNTSLPPLRSFIASDLLFGGGIAIVLLLFAIWGINRVISVRSAISARATSPSISDVLAGTAMPALPNQVTVVAAQATPALSGTGSAASVEPPTLGAGITVQINLEATGRTYMRITVDGKVKFEGRSEPGQTYSYQAARQIEVLVGDAAAMKITYNGRDLGLMGGFGEVQDRLYTEQGVVTPTATLPPTRTPTPNITVTPSQTPTRTPSVTPTPKP